jgi:hypothetical protein
VEAEHSDSPEIKFVGGPQDAVAIDVHAEALVERYPPHPGIVLAVVHDQVCAVVAKSTERRRQTKFVADAIWTKKDRNTAVW